MESMLGKLLGDRDGTPATLPEDRDPSCQPGPRAVGMVRRQETDTASTGNASTVLTDDRLAGLSEGTGGPYS